MKLNDFEAEIFHQLFHHGRVVLLMDGFDEISPTFNAFITTLLKAIKEKSNNFLVTSTRPHLKEKLSNNLKVQAYALKPLAPADCKKILEFYFKKFNCHGEILNEKLDRTNEFFKKLSKSSGAVNNPLLLRLVATVFSNDKFADKTQPNTFSIYENFINMMVENSLDKGAEAKKEATTYIISENNIMPFHHREAFKELFQNSSSKIQDFALLFQHVISPHSEQMQRIGLIRSNGDGKFLFIHRTFAEFFVAHYLFKNTFDVQAVKDMKLEKNAKTNTINDLVRKVFGPLNGFYSKFY